MKLSVMMIVFNTESILPKNMMTLCVENILPFSDNIIIVEGATRATNGHYFDGDTSSFTTDGRSTDGTIDVLKNLEKLHPEIKVIIGDGFWNGKTEMCNATVKFAKNDYLLQLDSDEFYHQYDMEKLIGMLDAFQPHQVDFYANHFFGGFDKVIDETNGNLWGNDIPWRRIFKNVPGKSHWLRHEPPVYVCDGLQTDQGSVATREQTLSARIKLFHYSYITRTQAQFKDIFFKQNSYITAWDGIQNDDNTTIFGVHPKIFVGKHPKIIQEAYNL